MPTCVGLRGPPPIRHPQTAAWAHWYVSFLDCASLAHGLFFMQEGVNIYAAAKQAKSQGATGIMWDTQEGQRYGRSAEVQQDEVNLSWIEGSYSPGVVGTFGSQDRCPIFLRDPKLRPRLSIRERHGHYWY